MTARHHREEEPEDRASPAPRVVTVSVAPSPATVLGLATITVSGLTPSTAYTVDVHRSGGQAHTLIPFTSDGSGNALVAWVPGAGGNGTFAVDVLQTATTVQGTANVDVSGSA